MATPSASGAATPITSYSSGAAVQETRRSSTLASEAESSKGPSTDPATEFAVGLASHIFNEGFCNQQYADIKISFFTTTLMLHRLILARSPYLRHLFLDSMPGTSLQLAFRDDNITEEAVYIIFQHLYSRSLQLVNATNARNVLATAFLFDIPELQEHAYTICSAAITADNVGEYISWLGAGSRRSSNGLYAANPAHAQPPNSAGEVWADPETASYGEYSARLRADVLDYLFRILPQQLSAPSADGSAVSLHTDPRLLAAYAPLPFDLFKAAVEAPELPIPFMQDRFAFAKRAITQRKKLAAAAAAASGASSPVAQFEESVVLALKDDGSGMAVHITRKPKRGRVPLWKVEG